VGRVGFGLGLRIAMAGWALAVSCPTTSASEPAALPPRTKVLRDLPYVTPAHPRQTLDLFLPDRSTATPLAIFIHGGGFSGGDKDKLNPSDLRQLLEAGIAVASLNYRFYRDAPLPGAFDDCARAVQVLRARAAEWNLLSARVAAFGGSAGAQIAMYLAFHDDLADPQSADPIARQSTRLTCVATTGGQITMDAAWWKKHVPEHDVNQTDPRVQFGVPDLAEAKRRLLAVAALGLISRDDPPIFMSYGMAPGQAYPSDKQTATNWKFHHVVHGVELQQVAAALGLEFHLKYPGAKARYSGVVEFLQAKLLGNTAAEKPKIRNSE
jgi:acetyl esterase